MKVPAEGDYLVSALYNNGGDTTSGNYAAIRSVLLDGEDYGTMSFSVTFNDVFYRSPRMKMHLIEGEHTITFTYNNGNIYDQNMNINRNNLAMDQLILENTSSEPIPAESHLLTAQWSGNASMEVSGNADEIISTNAIYGAKVLAGEKLTFTFTPVNGAFSSAKLNGEDIPFEADGCTYTLTMPNENTSLRFAFTNVNKGILEVVLNEALAVPQETIDKLVPSVKKQFTDALNNAQTVYDDEAATQKEVDKAWNDLMDAMHLLAFEGGNKEVLGPAINTAEELLKNAENFTPDSAKALEEALEAAKEVYGQDEPLKVDVDKAFDDLQKAIDGIVVRADFSLLQNAVDEAESLDLSKYIEGKEMDAFKKVLKEAQALLEDANAKQNAVDDKTFELVEAMTALRKIPTREEMKAQLAEMEQVDLNGYTDRSVANFQASKNILAAAIANENASDEELAAAYYGMKDAYNALEKVETPDPKPTPKPDRKKGSSSSNKSNTYGAEGTAVANPLVNAAQNISSQKAYVVSDTTVNFTLKRGSAYCFKMTVVNGNVAPSFTVGNGDVLKTQFVAKIGNDCYYRVYAVGTPGQSTGVYTTLAGQNAVKHCTVTIG